MMADPACSGSLARPLPVRAVTLLPVQPIDAVTLVRVSDELRSRGVKVELKRDAQPATGDPHFRVFLSCAEWPSV